MSDSLPKNMSSFIVPTFEGIDVKLNVFNLTSDNTRQRQTESFQIEFRQTFWPYLSNTKQKIYPLVF